jgi:hypothetical protein
VTQHYTRNTVEASAWCRKCGKPTMHRIDGVRLGPCLVCLERLEAAADEPKPEKPAQQIELFSKGSK